MVTLVLAVACTTGARGENAHPGDNAAAHAAQLTISTLTPLPKQAVSPASPGLIIATAQPATPDQSSTLLLVIKETPQPSPATTSTPPTTAILTPSASPTPSNTPTPTVTPIPGSPTATPTPTRTPDPALLSDIEGQLLDLHNQAREEQGLHTLAPDPTLMTIARTRAQFMAGADNLTHYGPNGATVFTMMNAAGYNYTDGAENIHYNYGYSETQSVQVAMQDYLASPSHRAAILKPGFRRIGIGVVLNPGGIRYYSIVFSD